MNRCAVRTTVYGADKLTKQLDEIDSLVLKLRRKLAELNQDCLSLELYLNQDSDSVLEVPNKITE